MLTGEYWNVRQLPRFLCPQSRTDTYGEFHILLHEMEDQHTERYQRGQRMQSLLRVGEYGILRDPEID